jgi:type VI secretion system secreted protein Hcp
MRTLILSLLCVAGLVSAQCPTWVGQPAAYPVGTIVTYENAHYVVVRPLDNGWIIPTDTWFWAYSTTGCGTASAAPAPPSTAKVQESKQQPPMMYVSIEGTKQGRFKGESRATAHKEKIEASNLHHTVSSPRDAASGLPSGKRQHGPLMLTKAWGATSPQLFQALTTNEVLKTVFIEILGTSPEGVSEITATIKLSNATVSDIVRRTDASGKIVEDVSFTYQRIELEDKPGKTMATDDWHM